MMAQDDLGAVEALKQGRRIIEASVDQCPGRLFGSAGDSFMAEFPSAETVVRCASSGQLAMLTRNAALAQTSQLLFRAGVDAGAGHRR